MLKDNYVAYKYMIMNSKLTPIRNKTLIIQSQWFLSFKDCLKHAKIHCKKLNTPLLLFEIEKFDSKKFTWTTREYTIKG